MYKKKQFIKDTRESCPLLLYCYKCHWKNYKKNVKKIGRTRLPCTVPNQFALPSTTTKNKSIPTTRKSHVPFYMITNARISNFNFWIHVMLNSNISLGDLAVYNGCSPTFWSSIIYEHFTPPYEHIYCRLPYGLNLNQFSLFEYDCCQVIQSFKYYLDNKKHAYSSNHISLWTTCTIRSPIQIFISILCWIQITVHWSR